VIGGLHHGIAGRDAAISARSVASSGAGSFSFSQSARGATSASAS
jgi:hypothetical protein